MPGLETGSGRRFNQATFKHFDRFLGVGLAMTVSSTSVSLLQKLRTKTDPAAWRTFTDLYTPLLSCWLRKRGVSDADAADVIQEVMLLLMIKLPDFEYDRGKTFRGWLRTVTLNKLHELRRGKKLPVGAEFSDVESVAAPEDDHFWDVEYKLRLIDRASELIRNEFSPQVWNLYCEYVKLGRTPKEVAQQFNVKEAEVYRAKSLILQRLRIFLECFLEFK